MNEESDGINENENNNSEVVILPERSHVEELLLSDSSQLREQNAYERKLDEKLKDLGLYEDDMTINQKEELLAVVVISCETAEQEENKRQLIREYLEGAQSLEDEIEFSFQESAWLAGEANLLCSSTITRSKDDDNDDSLNTKIPSFLDGEASTSRKKSESFDSIAEKSVPRSTPDFFQNETAFAEVSGDPQSSRSENHLKKSELNKSRTKEGKKFGHSDDATVKIAITHPIVQEDNADKIETTEILDRQLSFQRQKLLLDKSMGCWKPCMSPKDKRLSNFRLKQKKVEIVSSSFQDKLNKYLAAFEKTASSLKSKRLPVPKVTLLNKPYVLMHHGSVAKKSSKLDNYDYMVGVSEKSQNNEDSEEKLIPCNTLTRAKSAFHRVKPISHGKFVSFSDQNTESDAISKVTRSGVSYGNKRHKSEQEKIESSPEVILDDSLNQTPNISKDNNSFVSEKRVTFREDVIDDSNKKLPKFSDLRPDVTKCKMIVPSPILQKDSSQADTTVKYNCGSYSCSSEKKPKREGAIENRSQKDDSSDSSSSLIDVETVIDDEIEDIVLKKKMIPGTHKTSYTKNSGSSKRLKRNES